MAYTTDPVGTPQTDPGTTPPQYQNQSVLLGYDAYGNPVYTNNAPYDPQNTFNFGRPLNANGTPYGPQPSSSQQFYPGTNIPIQGNGAQAGTTFGLGGTLNGQAAGAAPTYDPSNPDPYINYFYNQRYGTDAPPDQLAYWSGKLASGELTGNGTPATPQYWMGRLLNDNLSGNGSDSSSFGGQLGNFGAPLFQPSGPFAFGQGVPNVGAFNYSPLGDQPQFQLPTGQQALDQDPGYAFRLQQGEDALINSAAARGGLGDPNTLRAVQDYGQQEASQEYGNAYNRALGAYQTNIGTNLAANQQQYGQGLNAFQTNANTQLAQQNQAFNQALQSYQTNFSDPLAAYQAQTQANLGYGQLGLGFGNLGVSQGYLGLAGNQQGYNQLSGLAQLGLQGTEGASNTGLGYFNSLTGLYGQNSAAMGNYITGAGNANAAGQVGSANAWNGALGNLSNYGLGLGAYQLMNGPNMTAAARQAGMPKPPGGPTITPTWGG
jgi:hypothetical protein